MWLVFGVIRAPDRDHVTNSPLGLAASVEEHNVYTNTENLMSNPITDASQM